MQVGYGGGSVTGRPGTEVVRNLGELPGISAQERDELSAVMRVYEFRVSRHYASLIDWSDPNDPLRRIVLPAPDEIDEQLDFDPSDERANSPVPSLQHKYRRTALVLVSDVCAAYCRFCFRKRFTLATSHQEHITIADGQRRETSVDPREAIAYIAAHPEIDNVLVTGGDPLLLSARRLRTLGLELAAIPHVRTIRFGTKVPAFDPERIDGEMIDALAAPLAEGVGVHVMAHFTHPRELTDISRTATCDLGRAGLAVFNQTPLLHGINDDEATLASLFGTLSEWGVTPYYLLHCRPTRGNEKFLVTVADGARLVHDVRLRLNGLAKTFRYVLSHSTGKLEIVGVTDGVLVLRYHQAKCAEDHDRVVLLPLDETLDWPSEELLEQKPVAVAERDGS